jgi:hypothetical protein
VARATASIISESRANIVAANEYGASGVPRVPGLPAPPASGGVVDETLGGSRGS